MKKLIVFVLVGCMTFSLLTACARQESSQQIEEQSTESAESSESIANSSEEVIASTTENGTDAVEESEVQNSEAVSEIAKYTGAEISADEAEKIICETTTVWFDCIFKNHFGNGENPCYANTIMAYYYYNKFEPKEEWENWEDHNQYFKTETEPWPYEDQLAACKYSIFTQKPFVLDGDSIKYYDILSGWVEACNASIYYDYGIGDISITKIVYPANEGRTSTCFDGIYYSDCEVTFVQNGESKIYPECNGATFTAYLSSTQDAEGNPTFILLDIKKQ